MAYVLKEADEDTKRAVWNKGSPASRCHQISVLPTPLTTKGDPITSDSWRLAQQNNVKYKMPTTDDHLSDLDSFLELDSGADEAEDDSDSLDSSYEALGAAGVVVIDAKTRRAKIIED